MCCVVLCVVCVSEEIGLARSAYAPAAAALVLDRAGVLAGPVPCGRHPHGAIHHQLGRRHQRRLVPAKILCRGNVAEPGRAVARQRLQRAQLGVLGEVVLEDAASTVVLLGAAFVGLVERSLVPLPLPGRRATIGSGGSGGGGGERRNGEHVTSLASGQWGWATDGWKIGKSVTVNSTVEYGISIPVVHG